MEEKQLVIDTDKVREEIREEFEEYKKFAFKGRILDMAVAFILGTAFGKAVSSLSDNILMPLLTWILAFTGDDWRKAVWQPCENLRLETGKFSGAFVDFILISLILYVVWRLTHKENSDAGTEPQEGRTDRSRKRKRSG